MQYTSAILKYNYVALVDICCLQELLVSIIFKQ